MTFARPLQVQWLLLFLLIVISAITTLSLIVKVDTDRNLGLIPNIGRPSPERCNACTSMIHPFNKMNVLALKAQE